MSYNFDGPNKLIILSFGTTVFDVKDCYSRWKDWAVSSTNSRFLQAFSVLGGDPLPGARYMGTTYFLENGWKIRPYEGNHTLAVSGNLYDRSGGDPFVSTLGSYNVRVMLQVSNLIDTIATGGSSGPTAQQIATAVRSELLPELNSIGLIEALLRNKTITDPVTGVMTVYAPDGVTPLYVAQLYEGAVGSQKYRGQGAERRERLEAP